MEYRSSTAYKEIPETPLVFYGVWGTDALTDQLATVRVQPRAGESDTAARRDKVRNSWPSR